MVVKVWNRREEESHREFAYFVVYRDMVPAERNMRLSSEAVGKTYDYIREIGTKNDWVARASAYDDHCDELRQKRMETVRMVHDAQVLRIAEVLLDKVAEAADNIDPGKLNAQYLPRVLDTVVKVSHLSTGNTRKVKEAYGPAPTKGRTIEDEIQQLAKELDASPKRKEAKDA